MRFFLLLVLALVIWWAVGSSGQTVRTAIIIPLVVDASERYDREFGSRIPECSELLQNGYENWIAEPGQLNNPKFCFGDILWQP